MNGFIFSEAAWDDRNSFGDTASNFFCGEAWEKDNFSNFCARKQMPDNKIIASYYNLSAIDIVKGVLKAHIEGCAFKTENIDSEQKTWDSAHDKERKNIDKLHQNKNEFIYYGHEQVWRSRLWLNRYFKNFIAENAPDILFAFATSPYILWPLIQYLKKHTKCKVVLLIADDVYGSYDHYVFYRRGYLKRELKKCILSADKLYGISDEMSEHYEDMFKKKVTTLYKGCDLSSKPKGYINKPLRFVYAGNLFWGRDDILAEVADAIEKQNTDVTKAVLEIYSGAAITPELKIKLNRGVSSTIMGSKPYEEIKNIMHDADIVLHVESFEDESIETVKYSLSTKIIDCLQCGSQVLGIGPSGIASIEYLKRVDGAIVIDCHEKIEEQIRMLLNDENILEHAMQTREFAMEKHDISVVQNNLREEFKKLI